MKNIFVFIVCLILAVVVVSSVVLGDQNISSFGLIGLGTILIGIALIGLFCQRVLSKPDFYDREPEEETVKKINNKGKAIWSVVAVYILLNLILFSLNPGQTVWRYYDHDPLPVPISEPEDEDLSLDQLVLILDEIDLAYGAREPNKLEKEKMERLRVIGYVFFPAAIARHMKTFVGYIGSSTDQQTAFALSVQERYDHLARLAIDKGYNDNGFLYPPLISKRNGVAFSDIYKYEGSILKKRLASDSPLRSIVGDTKASINHDSDSSDSPDSPLRSIVSNTKASIKFVNDSGMVVEIYWKSCQGDEILYHTLQSGASYMQETFVTHPWIVRDQSSGEVLLTMTPANAGAHVVSVKTP